MGSRILSRRSNGRFRPTPSLEELGFDVNKVERICNVCGERWWPILISGQCAQGHRDSREAEDVTDGKESK